MQVMLAVCAMLVLAGVPAGRVPSIMAQVDQGRDALARKDPESARVILEAALESARQAEDSVTAARALFFLGLLNQELARSSRGDDASAFRKKAREYYRESLILYPTAGSTLYNLAEVHAAQREYSEARTALERAMEVDESRRALYAEKLGDIAVEQHADEDAVRAYKMAAHGKGGSSEVQAKLVRAMLAAKQGDELVEHLWGAAKAGQIDAAMSGAMRALEERAVDGDEAEGAFAVVVFCLARQNYTQAQLAEVGLAQRLIDLRQRREHYLRVTAILSLYSGEFSAPQQLEVWRERIDDDSVPADLSPRRAVAELAGALGRRAYHQLNYPRAEAYIRFALEAAPNDPRPVTDLASLYFAQQRLPELDPQLDRFEATAWGAGPGSVESDLLARYEYHRALGQMYAGLKGSTGDGPSMRKALHQLQSAVEIAERINEGRIAEGRARLDVEPAVFRMLGDAYAAAGRENDATAARFRAARAYSETGDFPALRQVLASISLSDLGDDASRRVYAELVTPAVTFVGPSNGEWDQERVKSCIVVLASTTDEARRRNALRTLDELGVKVHMGQGMGTVASAGTKPVSFYLPTDR